MTMVAAQQLAARKTYGGGADNPIPGYLEQEVLLWSPEKITLKTYDLFIVSAKRRDVKRMNKVLAELISSLNFDVGDLSQRLFRLYEYTQRLVAQRQYDEAAEIIQELRTTWARTFALE